MIDYTRHILANGLTVVAHRENASQMAAVNLLYRVGARNENPARTGFAHLFEHLMFRGTRDIPDFDIPAQMACGENNAFTNNDYTDYYITLPKDNIETALWLESDRMEGLDITRSKLAAEKKVVVEEYNQRYLNQPYGDMWLRLRALAYRTHPYRWATIGLTPDHIRGASLGEVRDFYQRYYHPSNVVLSIASGLDPDRAIALAEKWFGDIPDTPHPPVALPAEPTQTEARREEVTARVPANAITIAFHMGDRLSRSYYLCDVISDLLAGGTSARLYESLVKRRKLFSSVNAYITGDLDPGLFVVTGHLLPGVAVAEGEKALWGELEILQQQHASARELEKVKNKFEAGVIFGEVNVMNRAMNLGFYEMAGDITMVNKEVDIYRSVAAGEIMAEAQRVFVPQNSSTLLYIQDEGRP